MSISISNSVGRGGKNSKADVRKIQTALNQVVSGAALVVDGDCGSKTIARIEKFQRIFMRRPDGRIDPAGRSMRQLNQMLVVKPVKRAVKKAAAKSTRRKSVKKAAAKAVKKSTTKAVKKSVKKAASKKAATTAASAIVKAGAKSVKKTAKKTVKKTAKKKSSGSAGEISISGSVGRDGDNREDDTRIIQQALNEAISASPLKVDGKIGAKTIGKIEAFQKGFMSKPDGRIDPKGGSIRRLREVAPSLRGAWKGDSSRWSEAKKLDSLDRDLRKKVEKVLERLKGEGFKPKIVFAWRSVAVQQELVAKGHSKVRFSFHNAQYKNGRPRAYAADIIDRRWAWNQTAMDEGFWDALGRIAKSEGLFWGGDWRSFKDWAHVQSFPNNKLREIKRQSGLA